MSKEPIGKIVITVFEHGATKAEFSGNVPPNAVITSRISLGRGYQEYLRARGATERKNKVEKQRLAAISLRDEQRKQRDVNMEKVKKDQERKDQLKELETELSIHEGIPVATLSVEEQGKRKKEMDILKKKIQALKSNK